jgi:hypothetical protein
MVMNAIEELLTAVTSAADAQEGAATQVAPAPRAVDPYGEALEEIASASAQLHAVVQRIRAQFMRLADIEIRKALDLALGAALSMPAPAAPAVHARPAPVAPPAPAVHAAPEPVAEVSDEEEGSPSPANNMQGTVRLLVFANGNMRRVIQFVDELTQRPQFRMMRMAGSPSQQGAVVSVALREPVAFMDVLTAMGMVASVEETTDPSVPGDGPLLTVQLRPV